jgi:aminoglycoside phosphotransferase (APT) family kinase protein
MQLSRQPGVPLHRALAGQSSRYRRLIISNAGLTLNEVHAHIPPSGSELDLPYAGEGWWERIHTGLESMGRVIVADNRALTDVVLTVLGRTVNLARSLDEPAHSLVHGDFGGANILVSPGGSISGVLDWEWAVRGDPNLDVARALWLPHVGRSSRLWETASERKLFLDSHSAGDRRRISTEAWFIYSVWFTFSFLTFCIATGADRRRYCAVWSNLLSFAHGNKGFGSGGDGPSARQLTRRQ